MQLERFVKAKKQELDRLHRLEACGRLPVPQSGKRPPFMGTLKAASPRPHVIAEFKRASPSKGDIFLDLSPAEAAQQYAGAGAACLSVLTEEHFFKGSLGYLQEMASSGLPMLRKDFLFDPLQIAETASTPASALLLIVRIMPDPLRLRSLREQTEAFGMDAVVEVFDEGDLAIARESGARIIQVNARNLDTLETDRAGCLNLAEKHRHRGSEVWIAASGITRPEHLRQAGDAGFQAVLAGTVLMEKGTPGASLNKLLGTEETPHRPCPHISTSGDPVCRPC